MTSLQQIIEGHRLDLQSSDRFATYQQIHRIIEDSFHERKSLPSSILANAIGLKRFCEHVHSELEETHSKRFTDWASFLKSMPADGVLLAINHEELQFGDMENSCLVFVGSGPCPYSAITILLIAMSRKLGTRATIGDCISTGRFSEARLLLTDAADQSWAGYSLHCVDSDSRSCQIATRFLRKAKTMDSKVTQVFGEQYSLDIDEKYVFIAAAATNKRKLTTNFLQQLLQRPTNGMIIIRAVSHDSPLSILYEPFELADLPFELANHVRVASSYISVPSSCYSTMQICVHASDGD